MGVGEGTTEIPLGPEPTSRTAHSMPSTSWHNRWGVAGGERGGGGVVMSEQGGRGGDRGTRGVPLGPEPSSETAPSMPSISWHSWTAVWTESRRC